MIDNQAQECPPDTNSNNESKAFMDLELTRLLHECTTRAASPTEAIGTRFLLHGHGCQSKHTMRAEQEKKQNHRQIKSFTELLTAIRSIERLRTVAVSDLGFRTKWDKSKRFLQCCGKSCSPSQGKDRCNTSCMPMTLHQRH